MLNRLQYVLLKEAINLVEEGSGHRRRTSTSWCAPRSAYRLAVLRPVRHCRHGGPRCLSAPASARCEEHYGERLAAPEMLTELVDGGRLRVKQGGGFVTPAGDQAPLVAYRNTAYARLGPAPSASSGPPHWITDLRSDRKRSDECHCSEQLP